MDSDAPPPGVTVDADGDDSAGSAALPEGVTEDAPEPEGGYGDTRPPPGAISDFGEWGYQKLHNIVAGAANAIPGALSFEHYRPFETAAPTEGATRFQNKLDEANSAVEDFLRLPHERAAVSPTDTSPAARTERYLKTPEGQRVTQEAQDISMIAAPFAGLEREAAVAPAATTTAPLGPLQAEHTLSAAEVKPSVEGLHPDTAEVVNNATSINKEALERHRNAETLPMPEGEAPTPLRKSQATRDGVQSDLEWNHRDNADTQGLIRDSINGQTKTLASSMGEIRRQATPDILQRTTTDHGQTAIDEIKTRDNNAVTDIRSKYKGLADAAHGVMPLDTVGVVHDIDEDLSKNLLGEVAAGDGTVSGVLNRLRPTASKEGVVSRAAPLSFDEYNNAIRNLASVQRRNTPESVAAGIVRSHLEDMPLSPEWSQLKGLRDTASSAAKNRFDIIDRNPAYKAAVNDDVPRGPGGLHVVGAPSPLAPKFMDNYVLGGSTNASPAYVARLKGVMQGSPDFHDALEASALNKLRDAGGLNDFDEVGSGGFRSAAFGKAFNGMSNKAGLLMKPETLDKVGRLKQYSDDVSWEPPASAKNRSNTAQAAETMRRFGAQDIPGQTPPAPAPGVGSSLAGLGTDLVAAHLGVPGIVVKKAGTGLIRWRAGQKAAAAKAAELQAKEAAIQSQRDARLKFAQDATARGAGIDMGATPPPGSRASGGRVDHEVLVSRLMNRWHTARKHANQATKPILNLPDESVAKALKIANSRAHL